MRILALTEIPPIETGHNGFVFAPTGLDLYAMGSSIFWENKYINSLIIAHGS